ncbi:MAG TPA: ABC transporter ATP-binding protein [Solirubrobacterales bacterium]
MSTAAEKPTEKQAPAASSKKGDVLTLENLTVARGGRPVVRDVSLRIDPGEVTALLGPNGAGKSSLVLAVSGVLRPENGSVKLNGTDLGGRRPEKIREAGVAVVPEGRRLLSDLSVKDNLRVATYALPRGEADAGLGYALEMFPELKERLDLQARSLSGGEQQMLVLAQALVSKPKFVLIDELSLGLAPVVVKRLIPRIQKLAEEGIGVLLIEQFATIALGLARGAYVMGHGTIEFSGEASELQKKPELLQSAYLTPASSNGGERER